MKSLPTSYTAARKWGIILLLALASLGGSSAEHELRLHPSPVFRDPDRLDGR